MRGAPFEQVHHHQESASARRMLWRTLEGAACAQASERDAQFAGAAALCTHVRQRAQLPAARAWRRRIGAAAGRCSYRASRAGRSLRMADVGEAEASAASKATEMAVADSERMVDAGPGPGFFCFFEL